MTSPLVSIIIPCFNGERFIGNAIRSSLVQTYAQTEVIVVDDGSTDGTLDIIRSFGNKIRWASTPNRGGGSARNYGVELARGELIQFLDADDELVAHCIEAKLAAYERSPDVTPCCDWERRSVDGLRTRHQISGRRDSVVLAAVAAIAISSPLHRRDDLLRVGGFDVTLPCSQERDLHLRLACGGVQFERLPESLFQVNRRPGSVSDDYSRVLLQHYRIYSRAASELRLSGQLTPERSFALARVLALDGRRLYHRGLIGDARRYWQLAQSIDSVGMQAAYSRTYTRNLLRIVGPEFVDRSVRIAKRISVRLGVEFT